MTDLTLVSICEEESLQLEVTGAGMRNMYRGLLYDNVSLTTFVHLYSCVLVGHDLQSLLYNYMNELLFKFSSDSFVTAGVNITEFDREHYTIKATL